MIIFGTEGGGQNLHNIAFHFPTNLRFLEEREDYNVYTYLHFWIPKLSWIFNISFFFFLTFNFFYFFHVQSFFFTFILLFLSFSFVHFFLVIFFIIGLFFFFLPFCIFQFIFLFIYLFLRKFIFYHFIFFLRGIYRPYMEIKRLVIESNPRATRVPWGFFKHINVNWF